MTKETQKDFGLADKCVRVDRYCPGTDSPNCCRRNEFAGWSRGDAPLPKPVVRNSLNPCAGCDTLCFGCAMDAPLETGEGDARPMYKPLKDVLKDVAVKEAGMVDMGKYAPGNVKANAAAPTGLRFNSGKAAVSLLIPGFLLAMAMVLTKGAIKYARDNWMKGLPLADIHDSLGRHWMKSLAGESNDAESGEPHEAHIAVNAMFAWWMRVNRPDLNNLLVRPAK